MYSSAPSPPFIAGHTSSGGPASPTSPSRSGRLRGLSYLRSYTHTHLLSRESHASSNTSQQNQQNQQQIERPSTLARATSYPSPAATQSAARGSAALTTPAAPQDRTASSIVPTSQYSTAEGGHSPGPGEVAAVNHRPSSTEGRQGSAGSGHAQPATASSNALAGNNIAGADIPARMRSTTLGTDASHAAGGDNHSQSEARVGESATPGTMASQLPSIRFCAHQDPRALRPSLVFSPMTRILPTGAEIIRVGRYSERESHPPQVANQPSAAPVGFKSKVVSRRHCEFYNNRGSWFIKDVKSSSGTFLNHIRLSPPGTESKPYPVSDGDIVQLGIDFKGGEEMIFRCVKIRIELNKGHQTGPSSFNVTSHKRLRELNSVGKPATSSQDCSICLGPIAPCQSLFVAPCSHTWHYKCIRIIINGPNWPHFICPNCRCVADLEAELDDPYAQGDWEQVGDDEGAARESNHVEQTQPEPALENGNGAILVQQPTVAAPTVASTAQNRASSPNIAVDLDGNSDTSRGLDRITNDLERINTNDSLRNSDSDPSDGMEDSNSTVQAVNIINRRPVPTSHGQPESRTERSMARTPSPHELESPLSAVAGVAEGPMTPRNDVGPFVFDGSGGRRSEVMLDTPTLSLDSATAAAEPSPR